MRCLKVSKRVLSVFCMWSFYFYTNLDEFFFFTFLIKFSLFSITNRFLYGSYRFQGIKRSRQFWIFISSPILIVLFSFDSLWNFLSAFSNQIWPSSCDFKDKRNQHPKSLHLSLICVLFFFLNWIHLNTSCFEYGNRFVVVFTISEIWED